MSYEEQTRRLDSTFQAIQASVSDILKGVDVTAFPERVSPDKALVFEVIGPVRDFVDAARLAGLEWLAEEFAIETDAEEDSAYDEEEGEAASLLYVTMPTLDGLNRLLALWNRYSKGELRSTDDKAWWSLFGYLREVRAWSAKDRVDPEVQAFLTRQLLEYPERPVRLELDLWFREDEDLRADARSYVEALMSTLDGRVLDFATIPEIHYQAALIEIPGGQASQLKRQSGPIANASNVMRVKPQSLYSSVDRQAADLNGDGIELLSAPDKRPAIAALLDGYPVQNHELLANRVEVEEIDVTGAEVPVARRYHGTSMASLIIHGDLGHREEPLDRILKVVPILAAPQGLHHECTPPERLPIAMVYRAVMSLVVGLNGSAPIGKRVVIINHSICDQQSTFARRVTPWAKLLDYLGHRYQLLFVVSAGNSREPFIIDHYVDCDEFSEADPIQRQVALLRSIEAAKGKRLILSPAEALNSITVGALHEDSSVGCPHGAVDPFTAGIGLPNISSSVGLGINRGLKPDLVEAGGRQLAASDTENGVVSIWAIEHGDVGQLAASPDPHGGTNTKQVRSTGTSNAAALVTRSAIQIADMLDKLVEASGERWGDLGTRAVMVKSLLAHGCAWGNTFDLLDAIYPPADPKKWQRRREAISRFLGYGRADLSRIKTGSGHRITLLADDMIGDEGLHEYRIPIPRAMIANREVRRLILTLAYSSPIDPISARYRGFALEVVDRNGKRDFWKGVSGAKQPHPMATRRGTLQHLVLEGKKLITDVDTGDFFVGVQARAAIASVSDLTVPYSLAITLEMGQPVRQDVFADVKGRVRPKVIASARIPVPVRA